MSEPIPADATQTAEDDWKKVLGVSLGVVTFSMTIVLITIAVIVE